MFDVTVTMIIIILIYYAWYIPDTFRKLSVSNRCWEIYLYIAVNEIGFFLHSCTMLAFFLLYQQGLTPLTLLILGWVLKKLNQDMKYL